MKLNLEEAPRYRVCSNCHKPMARATKGSICISCIENSIFPQVRDFIEKNNVTEIEVAEQFDIPLERVRAWISDGKLTYRKQ